MDETQQKRLESLEQEIRDLRKAERSARLEAGLSSAWGTDLPRGDKGDFLRMVTEKRFQWNEESRRFEDRLGVLKDFSDWRKELESENDIFKVEQPKAQAQAPQKRRITQQEFAVELPKDPKLKAAFLRGEVEVVD